MSITTEILRIKGGKSDIKTFAAQKNMGEIPSATKIDDYAQYLNEHFPDFTYGVTYDGTKVRGKTEKWNQKIRNPSTVLNFTPEMNTTRGIEAPLKVVLGNKYLVLANQLDNMTSNLRNTLRLDAPWGSSIYEQPSSNYLLQRGLRCWIFTSTFSSDNASLGLWVASPSNDVSYSNFSFIDLTDKFGAGNEPTSVDDERIQRLIAYAKDHPQYDAGSLTYAYYKGTKLGQYDYIDTSSNILHIGGKEINLESLTFHIAWQNTAWYTDQITDGKTVVDTSAVNYSLTSAYYKNARGGDIANGEIGIGYWQSSGAHRLGVCNGSSTTRPSGSLYYELANPIEIDLS